MKNFSVYDGTGRIVRTGLCKEIDLPRVVMAGESYVDYLVNPETEYMVDGSPATRPTNPVTLDKKTVTIGESATFSSVPTGTTFDVDGDVVTVNDGSLVLTFDTEGEYPVRITCFPYLDHEVTITCS